MHRIPQMGEGLMPLQAGDRAEGVDLQFPNGSFWTRQLAKRRNSPARKQSLWNPVVKGLPPKAGAAPDPEWEPFRGPFQRWPRIADTFLALFSFAMTFAMWNSGLEVDAAGQPLESLSPFVFLTFVVGNGALYWRRRHPLRVHGVVLGASVLALLYLGAPMFAMAFSLYALGRYADDEQLSTIGVVSALLLSAVDNFLLETPGFGGVIALGLVFGFWYVGRRVRFRGVYLTLLEERALQLERQQAAEADRAVVEERTRIARELHDIVAHQVSLMTVQASAAKTVAEKDPQAAAQAMASVESAGRQALDELRHLLGVLRPGSANNGLGPQPGRADIPRLIEELKSAGLAVSLSDDTTGAELPARVDLSLFRIVQEALTNVLKHAGPQARAGVKIARDAGGIRVEVRDNGASATRLPGSGNGITGMRERAQLLGGRLEAGPMPEGGFRIRAYLPSAEGR